MPKKIVLFFLLLEIALLTIILGVAILNTVLSKISIQYFSKLSYLDIVRYKASFELR